MSEDGTRGDRAQRELLTDHLVPDLKRRSIAGGAVSFAAQLVRVGIQIGAIIVLARLMAPETFGLIAMIGALAAILDVIKDFGLSSATIQKTDITQSQVSGLFCLNVAIGCLISSGMFLSAPILADFYHEPALVPIGRVLSVTFIASGLTGQHWALLRRQMRFRAIAIMEVSADLAAATIAVVLAALGFGVWALVAQRLTGAAVAVTMAWTLCRWRPEWPRSWAGVRPLFNYGAAITGAGLLTALMKGVDQILIGWLWGAHWLGLYERSTRLAGAPIQNLNGPLYAVAMPALCRLIDNPMRYRTMFCALIERFSMAVMPAGVLVAMTADWIVDLLFGPSWHEARPLVACFGLMISFQPVILVCALLYLSQNRPREMLEWSVIDSAISLVCILVGLKFGAEGVACGLAAGGLLLRLPVAFVLSSRRGPVRLTDLTVAVLPSSVAAAAAALAISALRLESAATVPPLQGIAMATAVWLVTCLAVYVAIAQSRRALATSFVLPALILKFPQSSHGA